MNKHAIQRILAGDYWAHWTYLEEEWRDFSAHAWKASQRNIPLGFGCASLLSTVCSLFTGFLVGNLSFALIATAIFLTLFLVVGGLLYWYNGRLYRQRLRQQERFVYISHEGIYRPEGFDSLEGLVSVTLRQGMLRFRCEKHFYNGRQSSKEIAVPVPHGQEEAARQVQEQVQEWLARSR